MLLMELQTNPIFILILSIIRLYITFIKLISEIKWQISSSNICTYDTYWMLISCIGCFSCSYRCIILSENRYWTLCCIIKRSIISGMILCRISNIIRRLRKAFSNCHFSHLIPDSHFLHHFFLLLFLLLFIFTFLFFINLFL